MNSEKIYFMGFMGSGKSTISRLFADKISWPFIDLDNYIEEKEGLTIRSLFLQKGQVYFRELESNCLREVTNLNTNSVIALGGGTPCFNKNMDLISEYCSIYLQTSIVNLTNRLWNAKGERPLIATYETKKELEDFIRVLLRERRPNYKKAKITFRMDQDPEIIVHRIIRKLNSSFPQLLT